MILKIYMNHKEVILFFKTYKERKALGKYKMCSLKRKLDFYENYLFILNVYLSHRHLKLSIILASYHEIFFD